MNEFLFDNTRKFRQKNSKEKAVIRGNKQKNLPYEGEFLLEVVMTYKTKETLEGVEWK